MWSESSSCNGSLTRFWEGAMSPAAKCARIYYTKSFYDNIPRDKVPPLHSVAAISAYRVAFVSSKIRN